MYNHFCFIVLFLTVVASSAIETKHVTLYGNGETNGGVEADVVNKDFDNGLERYDYLIRLILYYYLLSTCTNI